MGGFSSQNTFIRALTETGVLAGIRLSYAAMLNDPEYSARIVGHAQPVRTYFWKII
jgi:hypothetical protein